VVVSPPPFDHSKVMIVDSVWSTIGSANWDPRSLRLNFEFNVECYDARLAQDLGTIVDEKVAGGRRLTLADIEGRGFFEKLRDGIAGLASPYL
jgi:cardiolipin synthase